MILPSAVMQIRITAGNCWVDSYDQDFDNIDRAGITYIVGIFNIFYCFASTTLFRLACRRQAYL